VRGSMRDGVHGRNPWLSEIKPVNLDVNSDTGTKRRGRQFYIIARKDQHWDLRIALHIVRVKWASRILPVHL
jgi:hypothetical protein